MCSLQKLKPAKQTNIITEDKNYTRHQDFLKAKEQANTFTNRRHLH